jgi:predicted DNA-binding transcriptional regulator AlpA
LLSTVDYADCLRLTTILGDMGRTVDLDDLIDTAGVAQLLGLSHRTSVGIYRRRYDDFPEPVVDLGAGRCLLWLRPEVEAWRQKWAGSRRSS